MFIPTHYSHVMIRCPKYSLWTQYGRSRTSADSLQPSTLPCVSFHCWQYYCVLFTLGCSPHKGMFISWTTEGWIVQILSHMNSFSVLWRNRPYVRNNYEHWVGLCPNPNGKWLHKKFQGSNWQSLMYLPAALARRPRTDWTWTMDYPFISGSVPSFQNTACEVGRASPFWSWPSTVTDWEKT